ncbi:hypothetical protein IWQ55_005225, partial [Labrenzia sp. EL_208]|nr:hypothetical protein [Labrenzia sp. EL_208]
MLMYFRADYLPAAICLSLAAARFRHDWPSGNAPTTRVLRRISFIMRSRGLLVLILRQWLSG